MMQTINNLFMIFNHSLDIKTSKIINYQQGFQHASESVSLCHTVDKKQNIKAGFYKDKANVTLSVMFSKEF